MPDIRESFTMTSIVFLKNVYSWSKVFMLLSLSKKADICCTPETNIIYQITPQFKKI